MASLTRFSLVVCPYCNAQFEIEWVKESFGVLKCECDRYPLIENILYLQKDDLLTNKKLVLLLEQKKYISAVYRSLFASEKSLRIILFFIYVIYKKTGILINREFLLRIFKIFSVRSKSWFDYLLKRKNVPELSHAIELFKKVPKGTNILDIGTGIGNFFEKIEPITKNKRLLYIGIDKNFSSLLISRLYSYGSQYVLICADAESGIPIINSSVSSIFYIDSFYQLFNNHRQIEEADRVLRNKGTVNILQLFDSDTETNSWGYGISPERMNKILKKRFQDIKYFNNLGPKIRFTQLSKLNKYQYSCVASRILRHS